MKIVAMLLFLFAVLIQCYNISTAFRRGRASQILLVPCFIWYLAVLINGDGFIFNPAWKEVGILSLFHLAASVVVALIKKSRDESS